MSVLKEFFNKRRLTSSQLVLQFRIYFQGSRETIAFNFFLEEGVQLHRLRVIPPRSPTKFFINVFKNNICKQERTTKQQVFSFGSNLMVAVRN